MSESAVSIANVSKQFGSFTAVDNISLTIEPGEIFGIIGPNGAGKTTTVNMICGMFPPTSGEVRTLGLDPIRDERKLRTNLGVQFQEAQLPNMITTKEALVLYSSFYKNPVPWESLAEEWGLGDKHNTRFEKLSGGQKQRLFICLALLNKPDLVVLDELTTGLDPNARRQSWELVKKIRDSGATVLLVTHFMEEAEHLCDRIALINKGRIEAMGTPSELTSGHDGHRVVSFTAPGFDASSLSQFGHVDIQGDQVMVTGGDYLMADVATELRRQGLDPKDLQTQQTSLDELFVSLTGGAKLVED